MANDHAMDALDSFLSLEKRFGEFLNAVTFKSEHLRVHSPMLTSILIDTGSLVESVLKSGMDNARYNGIGNIGVIRGKRYSTTQPYYTINDSRAVYRSDQFYGKKVWFLPRSDSSFPWHAWQRANGPHPKWWKAYNAVKHDRFGKMKEGKLGIVMHALGGAFLALVQCLDFRETLIVRGIIRSDALTTAQLKPVAAQWEPLATGGIVYARSQYFGYKYLTTGNPKQAVDVGVFT